MKKNILFIMNNMNCGGAEKALLSLLETMDYSRYNVDLFLFKHEGVFINKLPSEVKLLPQPASFEFFDMPVKKAILRGLKEKRYKTIYWRILSTYFYKTEKNGARCEQKVWKFLSKTIQSIEKRYDVAIGYMEKNPIYFCVDKVNAKKKLGWIHTDYNKLELNEEHDKRYFDYLDHIVTVSNELVGLLNKIFPDHKSKIICIQNIVSSKMIKQLSYENIDDNIKETCISLISVGRLAKEKGLNIALEAINILVKKGYDIKWYLIGDGDTKVELEREILKKNLSDRIVFLGLKENPYPYIKNSDIYIQTSLFEGKSISIEEAKILAKPIVITNFETAKNHIIDNVNGLISNMHPIDVANKIELIINNNSLRSSFINKLNEEELGTEDEIDMLYYLIET